MRERIKKGEERSSPKGHESCNQRWKTIMEEKEELLWLQMEERGPINKSYK